MIRFLATVTVVVFTLFFTMASAWACPNCGCEATTDTLLPISTKDSASGHAHEHTHAHAHDADGNHIATAPEKDRAAILAMAGEYKVTFDFKETVGMQPGYELHDAYHSEASEFVEVLEDAGDFISLQHILVVKNRSTGNDIVVKHWRQDWTYQDTNLLAFQGNLTWKNVELSPEEVKGTWSQAVYQVDDSPRYESFGKWQHLGDRSAWQSAETWRPLPRREYSKRSDYQVLVARNRHTITPTGWLHEQDNQKLVLDDAGQPQTILAHETGLNVYERTDEVDFAAGEKYWEQTAAYWQAVRDIWADTYQKYDTLTLESKVDDEDLNTVLFDLAEDVIADGYTDAIRESAKATVAAFSTASR